MSVDAHVSLPLREPLGEATVVHPQRSNNTPSSVIKRKRVLHSVWFFMKWNARPSCWKGSRRCSWARLACDCGSEINLNLFTRCSGWDYVLPVFVPVCIGAFPQRSDCDAAQTLGGNDWLLMGWRSSCRPNRWGAPLSLLVLVQLLLLVNMMSGRYQLCFMDRASLEKMHQSQLTTPWFPWWQNLMGSG